MKNEKGITLIVLTITIIVLLILIGVTIGSMAGKKGLIKDSKSNTKISELNQVQQALLEAYVMYKNTGNENYLVGKDIEYSEVQEVISNFENATLKATGNYKRLEPEDLAKLGITGGEDTYIVNYETGEVINETQSVTGNGDELYVYATNSNP